MYIRNDDVSIHDFERELFLTIVKTSGWMNSTARKVHYDNKFPQVNSIENSWIFDLSLDQCALRHSQRKKIRKCFTAVVVTSDAKGHFHVPRKDGVLIKGTRQQFVSSQMNRNIFCETRINQLIRYLIIAIFVNVVVRCYHMTKGSVTTQRCVWCIMNDILLVPNCTQLYILIVFSNNEGLIFVFHLPYHNGPIAVFQPS